MKTTVAAIIFSAAAVVGILVYANGGINISADTAGSCRTNSLIFYYIDGCTWCNKVKSEGGLEELEAFGVKITKINAKTGIVRHKFQGVPTFVINEKVFSGYKTPDELKELLGCPTDEGAGWQQTIKEGGEAAGDQDAASNGEFYGEKGREVSLESGKALIDVSLIEAGKANYFNALLPSGKTVYFFIVKDSSGKYRAAANGCQVCFGERKGFRQEGNTMVCENCGNSYPFEKIGSEKGGCNPAPIGQNIEPSGGKIVIDSSSLLEIESLF